MVRVLTQRHVAGREDGPATAFRAGGARLEEKGRRGCCQRHVTILAM